MASPSYLGLELGIVVKNWDDTRFAERVCDRAIGHEHHSAEMLLDGNGCPAVRNLAYDFDTESDLVAAVGRVRQTSRVVVYAQAIYHDDESDVEQIETKEAP